MTDDTPVKLRSWQTVSEADWEHLEARLAEGIEPASASRERNLSLTAYRKADENRHTAALQMSRAARGFTIDRMVESKVVEVVDGEPQYKSEASDAMVQFHARRWQPAYAQTNVQVAGELEVRTDIADALDRFTAAVAAAAVRAADRDGAELPPAAIEQGADRRPRLEVARLAGET